MVRPITTVSNASALASTATAATTTAVTGASDRVQALWASGEKLDAQDPAVVHETAARLVSELFFAPMLAEMREFPFGKGIADGGRAEAVFGEQLDRQIADQVSRSDRGLVRQVAAQLQRQQATAPAGADAATWSTCVQLQTDNGGAA